MKFDLQAERPLRVSAPTLKPFVDGETQRLTDVLLCSPAYLEMVPCCSATRESLRKGGTVSKTAAQAQHAALLHALTMQGVRCHSLPADPAFPDQCFTRDAAVVTPWGIVGLNPALSHRAREIDHLLEALERRGMKASRRIDGGTIEGGDVCIARLGLLVLGMSGERTTVEGADAFAAPFASAGWDVLRYAFDPHFLHLDTMFCMLDATTALACTDVLEDSFLEAVTARGIQLIPVGYKDARQLGCNVLSLDGRTILMGAGQPRVAQAVRAAGFTVLEIDISQFTACGGGIHCLTMPLRREPAA